MVPHPISSSHGMSRFFNRAARSVREGRDGKSWGGGLCDASRTLGPAVDREANEPLCARIGGGEGCRVEEEEDAPAVEVF